MAHAAEARVAAAAAARVGIYIGNAQFIQAPHTGDYVKVSSLTDPGYALQFVGAVRPYQRG